MGKKIIGAVIAVALVAFAAVPALASASPVLTNPPGTAVPVGTAIVGTNIGNTVMTTSLGNIECQKSTVTGKVTKNNGTEIEGNIESASFTGSGSGGACTTAFLGDVTVTPKKLPWCLKANAKIGTDKFNLTSGACGGGGVMEFTLDTAIAGECTYTKSAVEGTYTTGGTQAVLTVSEQEFKKSAGGFLCPSTGKLDMKFGLETDGASPSPIIIS